MAQLRSMMDEPGTQREYETIFIFRPETTTDHIHEVNTRIKKIVEEDKGKVLNVANWGKRKLAYEIKNELKGTYIYWQYLGESQLVAEIERNLRMLDSVIRYYTVRVDQDVDPTARPSVIDDAGFAAAATIIPDEEDTYLGRSYDDDRVSDDDDADGEFEGDDQDEDVENDDDSAGSATEENEE